MTVTAHLLTPDTQAILLLTGSLGQVRGRDVQPLSASEYHQVAQILHRHQLRPADLLEGSGLSCLRDAEPLQFDSDRIARLLSRGAALGLIIETWTNRGLWVISRSDPQYPQRLRLRLGKSAPPILYGVGNQKLLDTGGLAIVGSREIDDAAVAFTRTLATRCARDAVQVVSGGARGVDSEAMMTALEAGGTAIGVLAESLVKAAVAGKYRSALRAGQITLITAYDPEAGFSVGNAMGRNKQIYALSDYALVVSASLEQGGTWSGAVENLAQQWVPLFVRATQPMLPGNQRLIERGGTAFTDLILASGTSIRLWLEQQIESHLEPITNKQLQSNDEPDQQTKPNNKESDLFLVIWPYLEEALQIERTDRELAAHFAIELTQVRAWLQRAIEDRMVKKLSKPVRYVAVHRTAQATMLPLFP
ncbi:Rossmann fold nucleotide-binding protein involved in DNA uptake-like protein [Oscillochloris trichoides DG-6]|uniref:Rossmann fold nucleotide-binding protein involved in DNA uptake-like protein n=1 Tax=Oscillochloris trichoides DG-6 TaxID=765420 RepID=E1IG22_9CHLR|nr:DNA-processing protein DprA [Oscillochloris trichoides]EFO79859.1 Rossmann fold nucleotide-binding protein involved in DNA uptake-like protein [Oscillochloris trichoides DG-6]